MKEDGYKSSKHNNFWYNISMDQTKIDRIKHLCEFISKKEEILNQLKEAEDFEVTEELIKRKTNPEEIKIATDLEYNTISAGELVDKLNQIDISTQLYVKSDEYGGDGLYLYYKKYDENAFQYTRKCIEEEKQMKIKGLKNKLRFIETKEIELKKLLNSLEE